MYPLLPKIELHLHLDCSLSYDVVRALDPKVSKEEYEKEFKLPFNCNSLVEYIKRAERPIRLMQTSEQLRLVTLDLFQQLKKDNVVYAEIRFAPLQHLDKGLTPEDVVRAVSEATQEAIASTGIEAGIILCTLRHFSEEQSMATVKLAEQFQHQHVVGFDIAADEAGFPTDHHISAFRYAHEHGIQCTAHAGEACGPESVWETLNCFHPQRIGHGVRSAEDDRLLEHLKEHDIHLEVCPTSNIKTGVYARIEDHSAPKIYKSGVSMSISTDGRTISDVTLEHEYHLMEKTFGWSVAELGRCNLEAIRKSFANEQVKEKITTILKAAYPTK